MAKRPPAAQTAFGPMVIVACEQHVPRGRRLIDDELACRFLPPGLRLIVRACRWQSIRDLLIRTTEKRAPGVWAGMGCRKRYIDEKVVQATEAGVDAVVILGAGLDTRAYRLIAPTGTHTYEIDLPANVAYKRARLEALYGRVPEHVTLVPIDFETDDLGESLAARGFRIQRPAMFVWEAVTQYLTEAGVRRTLAFLSTAAERSRLVFTFVRKDFLDGTNFFGAEKIYQQFVLGYRVWHFGIPPAAVGTLLKDYGWVECEQVGSELASKYVEPTGRDLPVSEVERISYAEKRSGSNVSNSSA